MRKIEVSQTGIKRKFLVSSLRRLSLKLTSGAAASEEHSESSMVSGRMEALSLATTATRPLFCEKKTGRLAQQPAPRTPSPAQTEATNINRSLTWIWSKLKAFIGLLNKSSELFIPLQILYYMFFLIHPWPKHSRTILSFRNIWVFEATYSLILLHQHSGQKPVKYDQVNLFKQHEFDQL